jgi:S1-C subfamily serine protease
MSDALLSLSADLAGLVARAAPAVVSVLSHRMVASGFVWRPGLIVTASEALAEEGEIAVVLAGGERLPATLAGRDPSTDIALLRVDRPALAPLPLTEAPAAPGALAVAVGAQEGAATAALGVVALAGGGWRSMRGGAIDARIELDLRLRRAAEGGAVLAASGEAFGMAVFGPRRRVLVIPAATIARVAARLETHGKVARGYLGLGLLPLPGQAVMVISVDPNGPGHAADIRQGDVIVAWDGQAIPRLQAMLHALGPESIGRVVTVGLRRAGAPTEVRLTIGERPAA